MKASLTNTLKTIYRQLFLFLLKLPAVIRNSRSVCYVASSLAAQFLVQFASARPFLAAADVFSFRIVGWLMAT
jgi:hypothetical protein